jgi:endonuclease/exonuclease/phosphatase family metal-dependent hydrolase
VAALLGAAAAGGCATGRPVALSSLSARPCATAGDGVSWVGPGAVTDRRHLARACAEVGPPVLLLNPPATHATDPAHATDAPYATFAFASWNLHEGRGDIARLLARFGDAPVILAVQEATRLRTPELARTLGLSLAYVPSMPNGAQGRDDRGAAILSTLPLRDVVAIELPWVYQRRVAVMATIDVTVAGRATPLRVVSVHLDNRPGRKSQAESLARWLKAVSGDGGETIIAGDLNSWFGSSEETVRAIADVVPRVEECAGRPTFRFGRRLDHLFTTLAPRVRAGCRVLSETLLSDHHPIVLRLLR